MLESSLFQLVIPAIQLS